MLDLSLKLNCTTNELPDILQAKHIKEYLGISQALAYNLMNSQGFPTVRINARMIVPKNEFIKWLKSSVGSQIKVNKMVI